MTAIIEGIAVVGTFLVFLYNAEKRIIYKIVELDKKLEVHIVQCEQQNKDVNDKLSSLVH